MPAEKSMSAAPSESGNRVGREACAADSPFPLRPVLPTQVAWLQAITLGWMVIECGVALYAALKAHSVALLAFGSDSFIELLSASVVLLQFLPGAHLSKGRAERAAAVLLFLLAGAVISIAALAWHRPVETSPLGIAITALALVVMPVLAHLK